LERELKDKDLVITLEDVETAIKILQLYLRHTHKARSILRQLGAFSGRATSFPFSFEDIVRMSVQETMAKKGVKVEEVVEKEELTQEELERIRGIARKLQSK